MFTHDFHAWPSPLLNKVIDLPENWSLFCFSTTSSGLMQSATCPRSLPPTALSRGLSGAGGCSSSPSSSSSPSLVQSSVAPQFSSPRLETHTCSVLPFARGSHPDWCWHSFAQCNSSVLGTPPRGRARWCRRASWPPSVTSDVCCFLDLSNLLLAKGEASV